MRAPRIGVSAGLKTPREVLEAADYGEVKKISLEEAVAVRDASRKPVFLHLQYTSDGNYFLPTSALLEQVQDDLVSVLNAIRPPHVSFHFGPGAPRIELSGDSYMVVGLEPPLSRECIVHHVEENLRFLKNCCPESSILIENIEFVPEYLSRGGYRHIGEASFFSSSVHTWRNGELLDGIVFDVAHGLIASGNHPSYNGLGERDEKWADAVGTDEEYTAALKGLKSEDLLRYFRTYIDLMPLGLVREIHLSGIRRTGEGVWVDAHEEVGELELEALWILLHHDAMEDDDDMPVTLEYARKPDRILPQIERIRKFLCTT
jgi:uncharacterized protein (UPF0276 family)